MLEAISTSSERAHLAALASAAPRVPWDRLLFSAKESVYKAWFPLARRWLGFEDATIDINPANGTFNARILVGGLTLSNRSLTGFTGRWLARDGLILTAIAARR